MGDELQRAGWQRGALEEAAKWPGREDRLAGLGRGEEALDPGEALPAAWPAFSGWQQSFLWLLWVSLMWPAAGAQPGSGTQKAQPWEH